MEDLKAKKNITIEGIEGDGESPVIVKKGSFDAKNYLNVRLDTDHEEYSKELRIRLLPIDADSNTPFKRIKMHNIKVPKEIAKSGFKSYVCLEKVDDIDHEKFGSKCPFCETNRAAYKKSVEATNDVDKKRYQDLSLYNLASEVGIIRCIERGHEEDGPKFWKFNIKQDKTDPLNKIKNLFSTRLQESREIIEEAKKDGSYDPDTMQELNILDLDKGKDLKLILTAVMDKTTGKPNGKVSIDISDYGMVKPLTNDAEKRDEWVNDSKVWSDVFVPKTYDYLSILMEGEIPWFDNKESKWITKKEFDEKYGKNSNEKKENTEKANKDIDNAKKIVTSTVNNNDGDEELPY